jgi:hypothetical protein
VKVAREGTDALLANHPLVKHPYNAGQDRQRKAALMSLLDRDTSQEEKDNAVGGRTREGGRSSFKGGGNRLRLDAPGAERASRPFKRMAAV